MIDIPAWPPRFSICMPLMLANECPFPDDWSNQKNFSDYRSDRGGATMCGITQRAWDSYSKIHGKPLTDVRTCNLTDGYLFYYHEYWNSSFPVGLDYVYFDASVNMGCGEAAKILCTIMRTATFAAAIQLLASIPTVQLLIMMYTTRRMAVYKEMPTYYVNGKGWEARALLVEQQALKMI